MIPKAFKHKIGKFLLWMRFMRELGAEAKARKSEVSRMAIFRYFMALPIYLVSFDEYFNQYDFPSLNSKSRKEFVTRDGVRLFYADIPWSVKRIFWEKDKFLKRFSKYIHRKWMVAKDSTFEEFKSFVYETKVIAKPMGSCCGVGIRMLPITKNDEQLRSLHSQCVSQNAILEQVIQNGGDLQSFHPDSLNTIRVVTVRNIKTSDVMIFGAFFRMGRGGSQIDNAHAGGIFAQINVETGVIESEGLDVRGHRYAQHPDTHKQIIGFQIPRWNEIKQVCIEAAGIVPENYITGWDVVINENEEIEFVEGNHGPDWDVMQSPLCIGVKKRLTKALGKKIG